jgi:hypothetical protein
MNKKKASQQYAANQMGGPFPKLGQKIKQVFKGKGGSKDHPGAVQESCSKTGCAAYNSGGGGSDAGSRSYSVKTSSSTGGEKNVVLTKKQALKRADKFERNRQKAPAMKNMTKKQKEAQSEMRPSRQDYEKAIPAPSKKRGLFKRKTVQKITI